MMNVKSAVGAIGRTILEPAASRLFRTDLSYSGAGEDRLVIAWLQVEYRLSDVTKIRYCDIGANHPKRLNNTFALYARGARGVLVEPDPDSAATLRKTRPRDTVLNVGVAFDERRSAKLQRLTSSVFNTFSTSQADFVVQSSKGWQANQLQSIRDEVEIELVPANDILAAHCSEGLHFLSIDAEGVDFPILASIDFQRFKPLMICVEASRPQPEFDEVLGRHGYSLFSRTPDNFIFGLPFK
jgi:FkbM family methyltransferase